MRKSFAGAARKALTTAPIDDDPGTLTILGDDLTGWPVGGAGGPFTITLDRDTSFEEKCLVATRVGNQLNLTSRGYDSTVERNHTAGATLEHTYDSIVADEANRLANLLETAGSMYVFDGVNVVELVVGGLDEVLMSDPGEPLKVQWFSRLIPISASAPTYKAGDRYYDSTLNALMVGVEGSWVPATMGVVVFASAAARNAVFGATNTPVGQPAWLIDEERLTIGIGVDGWQEFPKPGEWAVHYADEAAVLASTLPTNSLAVAEDVGQIYMKRPVTGWVAVGNRVTVEDGSGYPATPLEGDIHLIPVT
jgi:hypothetical protein